MMNEHQKDFLRIVLCMIPGYILVSVGLLSGFSFGEMFLFLLVYTGFVALYIMYLSLGKHHDY